MAGLKYIFAFLLSASLLVICACSKTENITDAPIPLIECEEEPLSSEIDFFDGMISNAFFGITTGDPEKALENVSCLQRALDTAVDKGITSLKLERGAYYFDGRQHSQYILTSVMVPSNMHLDLNGSILIQVANDEPRYVILAVNMVDNVKISNGTLIGDRSSHTYTRGSNHTWGFGVFVRGSTNIELSELSISDMTGDGIYITGNSLANPDEVESRSIVIRDCVIYNCRRQGISVTGVDGLEIFNNEIRDINGTDPQSCIDLETNVDNSFKKNSNISIHDNILVGSPDSRYKRTIVCHKGCNNILIENNIIDGKLSLRYGEQIQIIGNIVSGGDIDMTNGISDDIYEVTIMDNEFSMYEINVSSKRDIYIIGNSFQNGKISITNSSAAIIDNIFTADKTMAYGISAKITTRNLDYFLYTVGNEFLGSFKKTQNIKSSDFLTVSDSREEALFYIRDNGFR